MAHTPYRHTYCRESRLSDRTVRASLGSWENTTQTLRNSPTCQVARPLLPDRWAPDLERFRSVRLLRHQALNPRVSLVGPPYSGIPLPPLGGPFHNPDPKDRLPSLDQMTLCKFPCSVTKQKEKKKTILELHDAHANAGSLFGLPQAFSRVCLGFGSGPVDGARLSTNPGFFAWSHGENSSSISVDPSRHHADLPFFNFFVFIFTLPAFLGRGVKKKKALQMACRHSVLSMVRWCSAPDL